MHHSKTLTVVSPIAHPGSSSGESAALQAKHMEEMHGMLIQRQTRLEFYLYEVFCDLRIGELFDIITDFPDR